MVQEIVIGYSPLMSAKPLLKFTLKATRMGIQKLCWQTWSYSIIAVRKT